MDGQFKSIQNVTGEVGESKEKVFFDKAKEHKKEIAIGADIVILVAVLVVKNKVAFKSTMKSSGIEEILISSIETRNHFGPLILEIC